MTLQSSGPIDFGQVNVELGLSINAQISFNDTMSRLLSKIPSGAVSMSNFYGRTRYVKIATKGYTMGGVAATYVATTDKITYTTDTTIAQTTGNLSTIRGWLVGVSADTKGYVMGGNSGARVATTDKITYSTDTTVACTTGNLPQTRQSGAGVSSDTKGYAMGGWTGAVVSTTDRITYSTDTTIACTTGNLSTIRGAAAGVSDFNQSLLKIVYS